MGKTTDLLTDLSVGELEALADCSLVPFAQVRLNDLLVRKREELLPAAEESELDRLLQQTEQLTLLKTRARYTLSQTRAAVAAT